MPFQCFFSYARESRNANMEQFVEDLRDEILARKYLPQNEVVFFDGDGIQTGTQWKQTLAQALQTSQVFLAICSPNTSTVPTAARNSKSSGSGTTLTSRQRGRQSRRG